MLKKVPCKLIAEITMAPDMIYTITWLTGSLIGYFLSRLVWKNFVSQEIGHDDNIFLTVLSLVFTWFLVIGSLISLVIHYSLSGIDDTEAYWFGKKGDEVIEKENDDEDWNRSKRI